jgi:hypothetical protein
MIVSRGFRLDFGVIGSTRFSGKHAARDIAQPSNIRR